MELVRILLLVLLVHLSISQDLVCKPPLVLKNCGGCAPTCENPNPFCRLACFPACMCPEDAPIWRDGDCITVDQCICPKESRKPACKECNECDCSSGHPACTEKACPDIESTDGFEDLLRAGCWRKDRKSDRCIFTSPCIKEEEANCDNSPKGFCKECNLCQCIQGDKSDVMISAYAKPDLEEVCSVNVISCRDQLSLSLDQGCWKFANGQCRFVYPCYEEKDDRECDEGEITCNDCNTCQCRNGRPRCSQRPCQDPVDAGCYVSSDTGCVFVSPCPDDAILDPVDFCNNNLGATFCPANDCNACTCSTNPGGPALCTKRGCFDPSGGSYQPVDGKCVYTFFP